MTERPEIGTTAPRFDALQEFVARVAPDRRVSTSQLDAATAEALDAFDEAGIDALLLKGRALATLLYGGAERRAYSDVDLLIAPGAFDAAEGVLARLGYVDAGADDGIDDVGGVVHAQTWVRAVAESTDPPTVDLHRWLPGSRAAPELAWRALLARRAWIEVGGRQVAVLDRAGQAMHLATHAAQHGPSAEKHLTELGLALDLWSDDVWAPAAQLAGQIGATEVFAAGLRLTPRGAALASRLRLPETAELDWKIRHHHARPRGAFHMQAFAEAEGLRDRVEIVRRSLLPTRTWIVSQHPWADEGGARIVAAYGVHFARTPVWAVRAWVYRQRARRGARAR
jgi:hypothetical protein